MKWCTKSFGLLFGTSPPLVEILDTALGGYWTVKYLYVVRGDKVSRKQSGTNNSTGFTGEEEEGGTIKYMGLREERGGDRITGGGRVKCSEKIKYGG